jgi:hypothetical protein
VGRRPGALRAGFARVVFPFSTDFHNPFECEHSRKPFPSSNLNPAVSTLPLPFKERWAYQGTCKKSVHSYLSSPHPRHARAETLLHAGLRFGGSNRLGTISTVVHGPGRLFEPAFDGFFQGFDLVILDHSHDYPGGEDDHGNKEATSHVFPATLFVGRPQIKKGGQQQPSQNQ